MRALQPGSEYVTGKPSPVEVLSHLDPDYPYSPGYRSLQSNRDLPVLSSTGTGPSARLRLLPTRRGVRRFPS